jgi:aminoglycoside phosphotransferase (APT) family kinase protein
MDVMAAAGELLQVTPRGMRPTSSSTTFIVDLDDRAVVLKFSAPGRSVLAEARAYEAAAAHGIRVPEVLAVGADPEVAAIEFLAGSSLWSDERQGRENSCAWRRAGEELRSLHEIRVPGFGPLVPGTNDLTGASDEWCPFVRFAREAGIRRLVDSGVMDSRAGERLESRYDEAAAELNAWTDGRLLHGDLEGGHILVADDQYQGIIDFDQAQAGDPRWDLARVTLWDGDGALDALLDGYGRDAVDRDDRNVILPLYLLAFVVHHAVEFADRGELSIARALVAQTRYERLL